jgi:hypothetical protein
MPHSLITKNNPALLFTFEDSTLGLYLDTNCAGAFSFGNTQMIAPGNPLLSYGPDHLHIILQGRLQGEKAWFGPGNHFTGDVGPLVTGDVSALVWTLDLTANAWTSRENRALRRAMTQALIAADSAEAAVTLAASHMLPDPNTLCDHTHPDIRRQAIRLMRATPASTAKAIFYYVQAMPYRFGAWQERASDTLAKGRGMCTTKANLEVALFRAAGLEAGFIESPLEMGVLGILMPDSWRALMRPTVRHYFAAVKLDGRWHSADATYPNACCDLFVRTAPELGPLVPVVFDAGKPFSPSAFIHNSDPFVSAVLPNLATEMGKKSRFTSHHFEALNTRLDRTQGLHLKWGRHAADSQSVVVAIDGISA